MDAGAVSCQRGAESELGGTPLFGRFLVNMPMGINPEIPLYSLTERRFREYWSRTEGTNERQRFAAVLKLMQSETVLRAPAMLRGIGKAIAEEFADDKWHKLETIVAASTNRIAAIDGLFDHLISGDHFG
jgi:hypothetical protein